MVCRARVPCLESWPRRCDHITEELLNRHWVPSGSFPAGFGAPRCPTQPGWSVRNGTRCQRITYSGRISCAPNLVGREFGGGMMPGNRITRRAGPTPAAAGPAGGPDRREGDWPRGGPPSAPAGKRQPAPWPHTNRIWCGDATTDRAAPHAADW